MAAVGDPRGFYKVLGIRRTASAEEVKAAFRERAKLYHPDGHGVAADEERFRLLREAYDTLRDPQRRLHYDAEGLAAERQAELGRRPHQAHGPAGAARPNGATRPGPPRAAAAAVADPDDEPFAWPRSSTVLAIMLAAALLGTLAMLGLVWSRLDSRDQIIANLAYRLDGSAAPAGAGTPAPSLVRLESPLDQAVEAAAGTDQALYASELSFAAGSAELDARLIQALDRAIAELGPAIAGIPPERHWLVLVEGYAGRAADASGLLVDAWELALLRVGSVTDYLVRYGISAERVAVRFHAGFTPAAAEEAQSVQISLLCCFEP